jgi:hypothetical protein
MILPLGVQRLSFAGGMGVSPMTSDPFRTPFLARKGAGEW